MEKYKVCPVCGIRNNPMMLECVDCETDLQNVPVVDAETERIQAQEETKGGSASMSGTMVRICDCGVKNPAQARRCSACGEDISMVIPTQEAARELRQYILSSLDGAYAYALQPGITVIGREKEMGEYLSGKPYVSRIHAELMLDAEEETLTVKNRSATNYTFLNNELLSGETWAELKDGDELGLGGNEQNGTRQDDAAYFLVRIGSCM